MDAKHTLGEPRVLISRTALLHNAAVLRRRLRPGTRLCAIVKADAYGHGAEAVTDTLFHYTADDDHSGAPAADALAVASLDEAAALADAPALADLRLPVIVFRPLENAFVGRQRLKIEEAIRHGWVMTLCSTAAAEDVARIAIACGKRAAVQVMIDTGMTRSGVTPEQLGDLLHRIDSRPSLRLCGLCTHFATGEDPRGACTGEQLARFRAVTDGYAAYAGGRLLRHAANSGATFFAPQSHLDMIRPGLALYGIDPTGKPHVDRPLRPVMKWVAPLVGLSDVPAGTTVGYNQTWTAARPTRVGLLPVGYADGYPRCLSNKGVVIVNNRPAPVIGRVSMDLTTIDLTAHPHITLGDEVTLLDSDPLSPASVYQIARVADTIPYEIFSRIGPRVKRVAVGLETLTGSEDLSPEPLDDAA